jgi:hypothetical protein
VPHELSGLYDEGRGGRNMTALFETSGWIIWAETSGFYEGFAWPHCRWFSFKDGQEDHGGVYAYAGHKDKYRAFAVRPATKEKIKLLSLLSEAEWQRFEMETQKKVSAENSKPTARDDRFRAYKNGIVLDSKTGLEWYVGPDRAISWNKAQRWVSKLSFEGGGWRMPTRGELKSLYQNRLGDRNMPPLLQTTGWYVWTGERKDSSSAWNFAFNLGLVKSDRLDASLKPYRVFALRKSTTANKDDRFIAYANGIVLDTHTGLEWVAGPDKDTNWDEAKKWVNYLEIEGGGWQMPTRKQLLSLYQNGTGSRNMTTLLKTTGWWVWSGESRNSTSAYRINFSGGSEYFLRHGLSKDGRAFAVRPKGMGHDQDHMGP